MLDEEILQELKKISRYLQILASENGALSEQMTEAEQTQIYGKIIKTQAS
jgi:hypothetical protein